MKKFLILIGILSLMTMGATGQNTNCLGLKNPTNFTLTGGTANSAWMGFIGTKPGTASTCTQLGANVTTAVTAANLTSSVSSSCSGMPTSYDINGVADGTRRFSIKGSGNDPGLNNQLSYLPPDPTYTSSIRIGNYCDGSQAEMLCYEFDVNNNNALVTIWYAMSLENALHAAQYNPEFVITVEKQVGSSWQLAGGDTLCYIKQSPTSGSPIAPFVQAGSNLYLPWNKVIINLSRLIYQRVRIKVATSDCSQGAHYGCCYIAGECQPMRLSANGCAAGETEQVAEIRAPKGALSYEWYRSRTGKLSGTARENIGNYDQIIGATDSILQVTLPHFFILGGDTVTQNTFLCKMTTRMNETLPITSVITTDVGNTKPSFSVDTTLACDASIVLRDRSITPYSTRDSDLVDTSATIWKFYYSPTPSDLTFAGSRTGGTVHFQYPNAGTYCVKVRTTAYDTTCWNEKTVRIRTVKAPTPSVRLERNDLCVGDIIALYDDTPMGAYRYWTIHRPTLGDTTIATASSAIQFQFDTTTRVTLRTRTNTFFKQDTNFDGIPDNVYCYSEIDTVVRVGEFPKLTVRGDTIVCNGDQSDVYVESSVENCTFDWYSVMFGTTPVQPNSAHLITSINQDRRFYVKVTSPNGCESWDSVTLYLVKPTLNKSRDRICTGDTVKLWAGKAAYYEWSSNPVDPAIANQETNDTIWVSPSETTTYSVIGHGTNGCGATALTQRITVFPYPIMHVGLTPDYIDSENPSVQFSDLSENGVTSLWNFGNGNTSTVRTVVFTFSDLSKDSLLISLTTGNELGCTNDTSFYIPVGIFSVWFPNAITPRLETNNRFKAFTANELEDYEIYIYDRTGTLVFHTTEVEEGWDGKYNGEYCASGAYVYIATYRRPGVSRVLSQKGTVTVLQ